MCRSISLLGLNNISRIQNVPFVNSTNPSITNKENGFSLKNNVDKIGISEMAQLVQMAKGKKVLPTFKQIMEKFDNGELDPRKLKKGDEITLNLQGKDYKFKIEKDGEFTCKVQGRDDTVRIYQGKNKWGQDCICLEHHYKKEEANFYVTHSIRRPVEEYDKRIKKIIK